MSVIKTVALDEKTAKIAETLPNFSHFVRECLYRHAVNEYTEECDRIRPWAGLDRCNPYTKPVCFVCWPYGAPDREDIKKARTPNMGSMIDPVHLKALDDSARRKNQFLIDLKGPSSHSIFHGNNEIIVMDPILPLWERFKRIFTRNDTG